MKKLFLLFLVLLSLSKRSSAAPGDTTWVQAHADKWLDWYNDFDSTVTFPDGSKTYRKIYMIFTLGKYACPGNPQYCADWDYTVQTVLMTPGGDTVELGRLITPYANSDRMTANWKGKYMFDVTDFYPLLKNGGTVRVRYSGYSGGFTANVKFAFIEGTPERNVLGVSRIYHGSYNYGHGNVDINTALGNVSRTAPAGTQTAVAKLTVTGHGGDDQGCAEFCPNTYTLALNGSQLVQQSFWRDNCGSNNYYPQNGTWIFDRGGWCPGDLVKPIAHVLTGVTSNSNYSLATTFPAHTSTGGFLASYIIEGVVIYYGALNKALDVSVDDILAPTNEEAHFRLNPHAGRPIIEVKNTGSAAITSLKIEYGVAGSLTQYTWNGTLNSLTATQIVLPENSGLSSATGAANTFVARILEVNGQQDADATNNELRSTFTAAPKLPVKLRLTMKTNKSVATSGFSETSWKIFNAADSVIYQRVNNAVNTTYEDTVLLIPGSYRLQVTDDGCDGINWWAYASPSLYPVNPGPGSFQLRNLTSVIAYYLPGYYNGDFGCGFTHYFSTSYPAGVDAISPANQAASIQVSPNPATQVLNVSLTGLNDISGRIDIMDATGRTVRTVMSAAAQHQLDISTLSNGFYTVIYTDSRGKLSTRVLIAK